MVKIRSCTFFKDGVGKNGKPWKMFNVEIEGRNDKLSTFDDLTAFVGKEVDYEAVQNGKYWNLRKVRQGGSQNPAWLIPWCKKVEERLAALENSKPNIVDKAQEMMGDSKPDEGIPF